MRVANIFVGGISKRWLFEGICFELWPGRFETWGAPKMSTVTCLPINMGSHCKNLPVEFGSLVDCCCCLVPCTGVLVKSFSFVLL